MNNIPTQPAATFSLPAGFSAARQQELFEEILRIYDLVEDVLAAVERPGNPHLAAELSLATPFVTQVTNSANIISVYYTEIVKKNQPITAEMKDTLETAFRNFYIALKELINAMHRHWVPE